MAIAAAAVALASCGNDDPNDGGGQPGKQLFVAKCGSCHILAAAETKGTTGPNLDAAFADSLASGMSRSTVESVVRKQIEIPMGNVMPADLVQGDEADAVAAYVADSIGKGAATKTGGGASSAAGAKQAFTQTCGSCHTLADAGTSGTTGPNLDQIKPDSALVLSTIKAGPGVMPPNLLSGKQAKDVADYISSMAGK